MRWPRITITRKVADGERMVLLELGRWWEIHITYEFVDTYVRQFDEAFARHTATPVVARQRGFVRRLKQGAILPFWYGYAYRNFDCDYAVYMPIPLNLVRAGWEWVKWKILRPIKLDWPHWLDVKHREHKP